MEECPAALTLADVSHADRVALGKRKREEEDTCEPAELQSPVARWISEVRKPAHAKQQHAAVCLRHQTGDYMQPPSAVAHITC